MVRLRPIRSDSAPTMGKSRLPRSGSNYDFVYGGSGGLGDLNADGAQGNDLIYIPAEVARDSEIRFSGTPQ